MGRPSNGCQETREFSQTCTEKELPNGDQNEQSRDRLSLSLDNRRYPKSAGATTRMESEAKLPEDEAEDNTLGARGGVVHSEKVTNYFLTRITKKVQKCSSWQEIKYSFLRATSFYSQRQQLKEDEKGDCKVQAAQCTLSEPFPEHNFVLFTMTILRTWRRKL